MGDPETREEVRDVMVEFCPLRTVLKKGKPCPYVGPTGNCSNCTFDWLTCADEVVKVAKSRRASYEREYQKSKTYKQERDDALEKLGKLSDFFKRVGNGIRALRELDYFLDEQDEAQEDESEVEDGKQLQDDPEGAESVDGRESD